LHSTEKESVGFLGRLAVVPDGESLSARLVSLLASLIGRKILLPLESPAPPNRITIFHEHPKGLPDHIRTTTSYNRNHTEYINRRNTRTDPGNLLPEIHAGRFPFWHPINMRGIVREAKYPASASAIPHRVPGRRCWAQLIMAVIAGMVFTCSGRRAWISALGGNNPRFGVTPDRPFLFSGRGTQHLPRPVGYPALLVVDRAARGITPTAPIWMAVVTSLSIDKPAMFDIAGQGRS